MNKTGLKAFVCSFVLTLSAIVSADKAFFYTPQVAEDIKIPRKNIALFFSHSHPQIMSSSVEPVYTEALETPYFKPEELKMAQNMPLLPKEMIVSDISFLPENDEIPLQVEEKPPFVAEKSIMLNESIPDLPLVYAGSESFSKPLGNAQKEIAMVEDPLPETLDEPADVAETSPPAEKIKLAAVSEPPEKTENTEGPVIIKATRQIIKIDNMKKRQERLSAQEKKEELLSDAPPEIAQEEQSPAVIPLQRDDKVKIAEKKEVQKPETSQIANLGENISLPEAETQVLDESQEETRQWQTMAEKHQDENPWLVARGSKYIKNKQMLKEDFASEAAQKKAEILIPDKKAEEAQKTKLAVQDNLLIPIPQELLDEDDLVPELGDGINMRSPLKPKKKVEKNKEGSFLDSITSVFSKENREKAIENIKEKSRKLKDKLADEDRPQILPTEIRLSFQPNRAEISGPTLRWIQAFAKKAADEDDVGLEIRIDGSRSFTLQQKRLNLLYNILTANDVPYQKINTVFVDREPNSFVVRTVKIVTGREQKKESESWKKYYQKW